ncbi:type I restriction endonuclease [Streptomyces sp. NBS 14/10]|nr:type I restriction endonuclease [Streptomyces sp. NBS 14/10]
MGRPGRDHAEKPLVRLLAAMGWGVHECLPSEAALAGGVCEECFRRAVRRINRDAHGNPWLTDRQLDSVWTTVSGSGWEADLRYALAGNFEVAAMLRAGLPARALPGWRAGLPETVRLVDWEDASLEGNDFRGVLRTGSGEGAADLAGPDLVLFVNGLPWVVATYEPGAHGVMGYLIDRIRNCAGSGAVQPTPAYLRFGQLLVAMDAEDARLGTVTSEPEDFATWRTVRPATDEQVCSELGCTEPRTLRPWENLVAGALRPRHLLDLVLNCVSEEQERGLPTKFIIRYPQFRAAHRVAEVLTERLRGATEAGWEADNRAGIVWHFADSERDRTMGLMVRRLRAHPLLSGHKVVVITNRAGRARELARRLSSWRESARVPASARQAAQLLAVDTPDLVVMTIQKLNAMGALAERWSGFDSALAEQGGHGLAPLLNSSHQIVVLVDDARRVSRQYVSLLAALPNAALLGFVGSPVQRAAQRAVTGLFGHYVDIYTANDAISDGVVSPLVCETPDVGTHLAEKELRRADQVGGEPSGATTTQESVRVYSRRREFLERPEVIEAKAAHMLNRWAVGAMRDGHGAQVVVASRLAAIRYRAALLKARDRLIAELDGMDPTLVYDPEFHKYATEDEKRLLELRKFRHVLGSIDVAALFSSNRYDPSEWRRWTAPWRQQANVMSFRRGIADVVRRRQPDPSWEADPHGFAPEGAHGGSRDDGVAPQVAFMVVCSRILSADSSPEGQMFFLDRRVTADELQQIMRLRKQPWPGRAGRPVVSYVDAGSAVPQALDGYDSDHLEEVLGAPETPGSLLMKDSGRASSEALWRLHGRIRGFLRARGINPSLSSEPYREDLLAELADPLVHVEFAELAREFLATLNSVMPGFESQQYQEIAGWLGVVLFLAWRRHAYDFRYLMPRSCGAIVDDLIEQRMEQARTRQGIPPTKVTAPDFLEKVMAQGDPRSRVAYLTVALQLHIGSWLGTEPMRHARFAERLEKITGRTDDGAGRIADLLISLIHDVLAVERGYLDDASELDPSMEQLVYRLLKAAVEETGQVPHLSDDAVRQATRDVVKDIARLVRPSHFLVLATVRNRARRELRQLLEARLALDWEATAPLAARLMELAVESREELLGRGEERSPRGVGHRNLALVRMSSPGDTNAP